MLHFTLVTLFSLIVRDSSAQLAVSFTHGGFQTLNSGATFSNDPTSLFQKNVCFHLGFFENEFSASSRACRWYQPPTSVCTRVICLPLALLWSPDSTLAGLQLSDIS